MRKFKVGDEVRVKAFKPIDPSDKLKNGFKVGSVGTIQAYTPCNDGYPWIVKRMVKSRWVSCHFRAIELEKV